MKKPTPAPEPVPNAADRESEEAEGEFRRRELARHEEPESTEARRAAPPAASDVGVEMRRGPLTRSKTRQAAQAQKTEEASGSDSDSDSGWLTSNSDSDSDANFGSYSRGSGSGSGGYREGPSASGSAQVKTHHSGPVSLISRFGSLACPDQDRSNRGVRLPLLDPEIRGSGRGPPNPPRS